jgi:flagellar FliL protein
MASKPDGAAPPSTAPKGKRRLVLMAAAAIVLLGGGAAAAYFGGLFAGAGMQAHAEVPAGPPAAEDAHGTPEPAAQIIFVDLPDIVVNLQATGTRMRFLRLRLALEVGDEASGQKVKSLIPRLLDSFQLYLRALTPDDVGGAGGMQRLKEDLIARSNIAVAPTKVADVLLKEMLVQ